MKKHFFYLAISLIFQLGCKFQNNKIRVLLENSSQLHNEISIDIFIDNKFYKEVKTTRTNIDHNFETIFINFPANSDSLNLGFKITNTNEISNSVVYQDRISHEAIVHINFTEIVFHKGDLWDTKILEKDSVIKKEFYSDVIYK